MSQPLKKTRKVFSVGNHMAAAYYSATKGDVAMVNFYMSQDYALEQAELLSVQAFHKLMEYLTIAQEIEAQYGEGALLQIDASSIQAGIDLGSISEERQSAARRFAEGDCHSGLEAISSLLCEIESILKQRSGFNRGEAVLRFARKDVEFGRFL